MYNGSWLESGGEGRAKGEGGEGGRGEIGRGEGGEGVGLRVTDS